ncbi:ankyrin repeat domain-containing protein [Rhizobacter sp. AJA081-3]|uniref:ankyrin repeat domain-containing protein n=1 Tax=Rhizobacter sp. AJA081-3 TaxID=2753607 RepID=UPI001ADF598A|nr:ankyrin repeat domain-containing protein [Rhizobacter sp. AJA081-3]QTN21509.1 ankyrin repeat domain-containing protein [Rhizobacter sp. AJA081-3]
MTNLDDDWFERERLHRAAADGDLPEVERLVSYGADINAFDDLSRTPLHYAAENEHYKVAAWLLERGAQVNANDEKMIGETALCLAAQKDYPEMVELLLKHGADPDINGWVGLTARIRAQRRKDEDGRKIAALIEQYRPPKPNPGARR